LLFQEVLNIGILFWSGYLDILGLSLHGHQLVRRNESLLSAGKKNWSLKSRP